MSPSHLTGVAVAFEALVGVACFAIAAPLARFRPDRLVAVLAAVLFTGYGASGALGGILIAADERWALPLGLLEFSARTAVVWLAFVFPDGRFIPPCTRWLALF